MFESFYPEILLLVIFPTKTLIPKNKGEIFQKFINLQIQIPNRTNPKKFKQRHIIIKLLKAKDKEKYLKAAREK